MNLFSIPARARADAPEYSETLLSGRDGLVLERIVSRGHTTPDGQWYDQRQDEWVSVLQGEARIAYENGLEITLRPGDTLFLPRRVRHRVAYSSDPCIWLAVYGNDLHHQRREEEDAAPPR